MNVGTARGQSTPPPAQQPGEDIKNDTDPTQPVLLSLREEYYNLLNDVWMNQAIVRMDKAFFRNKGWLGGKAGIITRFDLPLAASNGGGDTEAGLGDLYGQFLYLPIFSKQFALAFGSGLFFPTATEQSLGGEKWKVAPLGIPVWFIQPRKGLFLVKIQDVLSFAGSDTRPDVNQLLVTPTLLYRVMQRWWFLLDTEVKTDWEQDGRTSFLSGLQVGHMFSRSFGFWAKPEVYWGSHRQGDWNLKVTLIWFQTR
jgi:hypothetical protein